MMKKAITFNVLLLASLISFSQNLPFPTDSAVWHYSYEDHGGITIPVNYTIVGNTSLNSISYKLISTDFSSLYLMRQDSIGKVYARFNRPSDWSCTDTTELLLYDFNMLLNDSVYIKNCYGDSTLCILTTVDSILTSTGLKKRMIFTVAATWITCHTGIEMVWIEGIGNISDLFYNLTFPIQVCLSNYRFLSLDSLGTNISILPNTINKNTTKEIGIWLDNNLVLHSSALINRIEILDIIGRKIGIIENLNSFSFNLSESTHPFTGNYFIKCFLSNGEVKIVRSLFIK